MTPKMIMYLINLTIVLVGVIFTMISIGISYTNKKKVERCKVLTKGIVVDIKREVSTANIDGPPTVCWYPIYEYKAGEHTIRKWSSFGQAKEAFHLGEEVEMYYNQNDYNDFYVPKEHTGKIMRIFRIIGGVLLVIGAVFFMVATQL